jgi:hypothetical protein
METKLGIRRRIEESLSINSKPTSKRFWLGYITALSNNEVVNTREFMFLYNTIDLWKTGDETSRVMAPFSMSNTEITS